MKSASQPCVLARHLPIQRLVIGLVLRLLEVWAVAELFPNVFKKFHPVLPTLENSDPSLSLVNIEVELLGRAFPRPPYKVFFSPSYLRAALTSTWAAWLSHGSLPQSAKEPSKLANSQYTLNVGHPFRRSNDANGDHTVLLRCPPRVLNPM